MAAFAFQDVIQNRYYIRLNSSAAEQETDHALLLDTARQRTESVTVVLYLIETDGLEINAITARSNAQARVKDVGVTLSAATTEWIGALEGPAQGGPSADPNFEKFPEVLQYHLRWLAVVPLRDGKRLLGLLTLGRQAESGFHANELDVAERVGRLLTAVLERDSLKQKLLERKLVERAKGLLQQRRRLSEEQAYLTLRNNSRRRRVPMADVAKEIIDSFSHFAQLGQDRSSPHPQSRLSPPRAS